MIGQAGNPGGKKGTRRRSDRQWGSVAALLLSTTALVGITVPVALGADTTWTGATDTDWSVNTNWDTTNVPTNADNVFINTDLGGGNFPAITANAAAANVNIGDSASGFLGINNATLAATAMTIGNGADPITGQLQAVNNGAVTLTGNFIVGNAGQGIASFSGGADLTVGGNAFVGFGNFANNGLFFSGAGTTGTFNNSLTVGNGGNGILTVNNDADVTTAGNTTLGSTAGTSGTLTVTGTGASYNGQTIFVGSAGDGTLTISAGGAVSNANVSIGDQAGGSGTVLVTGASSVWNTGANVNLGFAGDGVLTLADGAVLNINAGNNAITIASQAGSDGRLHIGGTSGNPAAAAGTLNATAVQFGAGIGVLNFNHTDTNYTFAPDITGMGSILHPSGVTKLTGDASGFTGSTAITGGSLFVNTTLGGTVFVNGGTLGGSGTLTGALTLASGTLAPGNSIGTLNVANITINAGSTYTVELNDGGFVAGTNNDLINATGTATINGGAVNVTPVNGTDTGATYTLGTYTILTAAGGVTGTFDTLTDNYAFLNFALSYDANNVFLTSSLAATTFCLAGMTSNQCAAGNGVFSLGSGSLYTAVLNLSNAEASGAMDQLSGEVHASAKTALIEDSRFAREAAINRLRIALDSAGANKRGQAEQRITDRFAFWGQGFGSWGHWGSDGNAAKMNRDIGGFFLGGDAALSDNTRLGLMGGYSRSSLSADGRSSSGDADTTTFGAYGGGQWNAFSLKGGLAHSWHSLSTSRSIAFTGFSDSLSASYSARTLQAYGEASYGFDAGSARFEPFANLAYVSQRTNGFTESGGTAALTASGQSTDVTFTTFGLRAQTGFTLGAMNATTRGMIGWRHAFGDTTPLSAQTFASGGSAFTVAGVPIDKDTAVIEAGLDLLIGRHTSLGISYNGQVGSGAQDHGLTAKLGTRF